MRQHKGIDFAVPKGTAVRVTADGVVSLSGVQRGYGDIVVVDHGGGLSTAYGHLWKRLVETVEHVRQGQVIGRVGMSGNATGPHLHYEVRIQGKAVNPVPYLP